VTIRTAVKAVSISAAAAVVVFVTAFIWARVAPRHVPQGQPPLSMLDASSFSTFRGAFNGAEGEVRSIAMLSPT
jgi:hypothetical protein